MSSQAQAAVETARQYYNSADADAFYALIWGGEDIHIGLYERLDEDIAAASRRTVEHMAVRLGPLGGNRQVLDLGAGYGGAARYLASTYGVKVTALNLSEVENERHRKLNEEAGLTERIEVLDGDFADIPCEDGLFDIAWSQDALLHSDRRGAVFGEVDRVLKPGGQFVFTDPMQADDCPPGVLQPVLDRIHLESLGTPGFYRDRAAGLGWRDLGFSDHTPQLVNHYRRVLEETQRAGAAFGNRISAAYNERMKKGLSHWVAAGEAGHLVWGIMHFDKPA